MAERRAKKKAFIEELESTADDRAVLLRPGDLVPWSSGNVVHVARTGNPLHPTQKPVDLLQKILEVHPKGFAVGDPFMGSGSTLVACEHTGRKFFGLDLDPAYCDVAIERWESLTGGKAKKIVS